MSGNNSTQQNYSSQCIDTLEQGLTLLMENIEECIIVVNKDLNIITCSKYFEEQYFQLLGKKLKAGDCVLDCSIVVNRQALYEIYNNVFAGETIKQESETMVDGNYFAYKNIYKPVKDLHGNIIAAFVSSVNITQQKLKERSMLAESRRFKALIENCHDGICLLSADGKLSYVTPSISRILGYTTVELINKDYADLCHPEEKETVTSLLQELIPKYGETTTATYRMLHKNGSWRWLKANITNLLKQEGLHAFVFNYEDITVQKENEQHRLESEAKYQAFFNNSLDGMLLTITDGQIIAANPAACRMFGMTEEEILAAGRMGVVDKTDPRVNALIQERRLKGRVKGEVTLLHKSGAKFPAEISSSVFLNGNGEERTAIIIRDITERVNAQKQKEIVLQEKEALMNTTNDLMWSIDKDFKLLACNNAFIETIKNITGIITKPGDALPVNEPFAKSFVDCWNKLYTEALSGKSLKEEMYMPPMKNMLQSWAEISLNPIFDGNTIVGIAGFARDITRNKLYQQELEQINKKLEETQRSAKLGYWEINLVEDKVSCSAEVYNICGFEKDAIVTPESFLKIIHPEDKSRYISHRLAAVNGEQISDLETRILLKGRRIKNIEIKLTETLVKDNKPVKLSGTVQDITLRKQAEHYLIRSERSLNHAQALTHIGSWEINFGLQEEFWSDEMYRILGLEIGESEPSFNTYKNLIHPEDYNYVTETINRADRELKNGSVKHRIVKKDGDIRIIISEWKYLTDDGGNVAGMYGILQDITESEKTRAENEKLTSLLQKSLNEIYIINPDTLAFEYINDGALKNLGYSREEILRMSPLDIKPAITRERYKILLNKLKGNEEKIIYETFHKRADDSFYPVEVHLQLIKYMGKQVYVCIALDITERKLADGKIKESENNLRAIFENSTDGFILLDKQGIIKAYNTNAKSTTLLGFNVEMKAGKSILEFVKPERLCIFTQILRTALAGESYQYDIDYEVSGNNIWLNYRINPVYEGGKVTGVCITGRDITEAKTAEQKLEQNEKRFRALIENSEDAIVMVNAEGKIIYQSPSTERNFGFSTEEVQSRSIIDFVHPDDKDNVKAVLQYVNSNAGVAQFSSHRIQHKDGSWRWTEGYISNHLHNEHIRAYVINFRDVSQHINYLQDIERQYNLLREIAWMQSHVVRAPLARIIGLVHMLQAEGLQSEDSTEALSYIITASEELDNVVKEIIRKAEEIEMLTTEKFNEIEE